MVFSSIFYCSLLFVTVRRCSSLSICIQICSLVFISFLLSTGHSVFLRVYNCSMSIIIIIQCLSNSDESDVPLFLFMTLVATIIIIIIIIIYSLFLQTATSPVSESSSQKIFLLVWVGHHVFEFVLELHPIRTHPVVHPPNHPRPPLLIVVVNQMNKFPFFSHSLVRIVYIPKVQVE